MKTPSSFALDILVDMGIDCLNPIEPAAGMNLGEVKRKYGKQISLWGNVDCAELLTFKKPRREYGRYPKR